MRATNIGESRDTSRGVWLYCVAELCFGRPPWLVCLGGDHRPVKLALRITGAAISAALLTASFEPLGHPLTVWVALVPLLWAIESARPRDAFRLGFWCAFMFYGVSLHWFWSIFGPIALSLWALLAFYVGVFCGFYVRLTRGKGVGYKCLLAACLWVGLEYFRSECYYLKFSWFGLGYSQAGSFTTLQMASVFGVYGLSFWIVAANVFLAEAARRRLRGRDFIVPGVCLMLVCVASLLYAERGRGCYTRRDFVAAAIQTDLVGLPAYERLTEQAAHEKPALVVWPEFTLPGGLDPDTPETHQIEALARRVNALLIVGGKGKHADPDKWYSSAFIVSPTRGVLGEYRKNVPVQFHADGESGGEFPVFDTEVGKLGIAICYDATYPFVVRRLAANGAEVLAVPSYDMKFWGPVQWQQHSWLMPLRAVENRRWIIRSTSFGITQIIDPAGRVTASCALGKPGTVVGPVGRVRERSFYTRWGWVFAPLCMVVAAVAVLRRWRLGSR